MDAADAVPLEEAVRRYPRLAGLQTLVDRRWLFITHRDENGRPVHLDGFLCWPGDVTDALSVHSETNAFGVRTLGDENDLVWQRTGTLADVVDGLLELPAPDAPNAPRLVIGRTAPLWTPGK